MRVSGTVCCGWVKAGRIVSALGGKPMRKGKCPECGCKTITPCSARVQRLRILCSSCKSKSSKYDIALFLHEGVCVGMYK